MGLPVWRVEERRGHRLGALEGSKIAKQKKEVQPTTKPEEIHRCHTPVKTLHTCLFMTTTEGFITLCDCCTRCENTCSEIE